MIAWLAVAAAFAAPDDATVAAAMQQPSSSLAQRLVNVTQPFVGAPYAHSPLGEGAGADVDADPRVRWDSFDCTTFVETAIALAVADDLPNAKRLLDAIRYRDARPDYLARRHFPEAEWIPELTKLGFLVDVTRAIGGDAVAQADKAIDPRLWQKAKRRDGTPTLPASRIPHGTFSVDAWPLEQARANADKIPAGTLIDVVRVDYKSEPVRVTHQGIVIEKGGKKYLRHAADRMYHSVVDEPLDHFFDRMSKYKKWPVFGVHLARIEAPANWKALVPPPS